MTFDPFNEEAPADNEVQEQPTNDQQNVTVTKGSPVAEQQDGKIVVTLKGGSGYENPWIVIHAANAEEALAQLSDNKLQEVIDRTSKVSQYFGSTMGNSKPASQPSQTSKPPQQQAPSNETRMCKHGERVYKTGSKNGRTWEGFFCPTPKGTPDQCGPEFK